MVLAHVSEGGRRRTGLSWPNFSLEDILSLLPSPVSFPHFPEDMVFPYSLWGPQNPSLCPGLTPTLEFLLLLPSLQPPLLSSPCRLPAALSRRPPTPAHL